MRKAGHVVRMGDRSGAYRVLVRKPEGEIDHLENVGVNGRIIFKMDLQVVGCVLGID
jgi:hypothetical protein